MAHAIDIFVSWTFLLVGVFNAIDAAIDLVRQDEHAYGLRALFRLLIMSAAFTLWELMRHV